MSVSDVVAKLYPGALFFYVAPVQFCGSCASLLLYGMSILVSIYTLHKYMYTNIITFVYVYLYCIMI